MDKNRKDREQVRKSWKISAFFALITASGCHLHRRNTFKMDYAIIPKGQDLIVYVFDNDYGNYVSTYGYKHICYTLYTNNGKFAEFWYYRNNDTMKMDQNDCIYSTCESWNYKVNRDTLFEGSRKLKILHKEKDTLYLQILETGRKMKMWPLKKHNYWVNNPFCDTTYYVP